MDDLLKMNLQMFAADDGGKNLEDDPKPLVDNSEGDDPNDEITDDEPTVTVAEMQRRIKKEKERAQAEIEKAKADALRKAKLSEDEQAEEERKELEERIAEYERKEKVNANAKIVSSKLSEANLPHDDALVDLVTTEDEGHTENALNVVIDYVSKIKKSNTVQSTPNEGGKFSSGNKSNKSIAERAKEKRIIK